jgi:uncharacterized membrane protein (DUF373 family)
MKKFIEKFERYIVIGLLGMMVVVVFLGTVELAVVLVEQMIKPPIMILLNIDEMLEIFGFFLMILIGLELIETMKVYLVEESVHVEIIFLVAIIAITRKVIILDIKSLEPLTMLELAALILALSFGYYALKKALKH